MKILAICSALDLRLPYSCTPAWWQLLQALSQNDVDIIVATYAGDATDTPWWRAYRNPCELEGNVFALTKRAMAKVGPRSSKRDTPTEEDVFERATRWLAHTWVRPRWERHVARILDQERDVDAVLVMTVPLNHIAGLARSIQQRYGVPFYYYDGDVPASLPRFAGFQSGFRGYQGADLSEYTAFISNSKAGGEELLALGAREVHTLYYGADPAYWRGMDVAQDIDVFFYGHGSEYRREWITAMLSRPSERLQDARFAVRGGGFGLDLSRVESLPYLSVAKLRAYCSRSRINLLITRSSHASVYGSSTIRPFELAAMGCCMVSNPYAGIEEWFEPEREVLVVNDEDEAVERYGWLLAHESTRRKIGEAARERLLREHTADHRARRLVEIVRGGR